jgi:DNA mismatch repair protein MutL
MPDFIKQLPDHIASQIAAGEVIQRPASVIKELLENAVDAGATSISITLKQGGKERIQITDDGSGMSETDARMSFEKHATSKISSADDLFAVRTMGFRGEALASIAAIAQVDMRTRLTDADLGTRIAIEGGKVSVQEPVQCPAGTTIIVKNLFFNIPARRNFLKSDAVELKNCIEELYRVALAHPQIAFRLIHNEQDVYVLRSGNLKQRITALFGEEYASRIVPVEENTYSCSVSGFCGKPEYSRKTRGEQYLFINNRFIKSPFVHHAILSAYEGMLPKDSYPFYVLFIEMDPARIDVNVHPQKYEVKFIDDKIVYTFVQLGVKHALGAHSITPAIDFNQEPLLQQNKTFDTPGWLQSAFQQPADSSKTVRSSGFERYNPQGTNDRQNFENWQKLVPSEQSVSPSVSSPALLSDSLSAESPKPYQLHRRYILSPIKSGMLLLDQQAAHERILYEKVCARWQNGSSVSQQQLFPITLHLSVQEAIILREMLPEVNALGYDIREFGGDTFVVQAVHAEGSGQDPQQWVRSLIQQYQDAASIPNAQPGEKISRAMARSMSVKAGKGLSEEEMRLMIDQLFACEQPHFTPQGKKTYTILSLDDLEKLF